MLRILIVVCITLIGSPAFGQCRPPDFKVGRNYGASVYVSIQPRDFTIENAICLAQTLRREHPDWTSFNVLIFASQEAANDFQPSHGDYENEEVWAEAARQLHAGYFFDSNMHEERLDILPLGYQTASSLTSRINLPFVNQPTCRLEYSHRCLILLDGPRFQADALRARASGTVTLTGMISRGGEVSRIEVLGSSVTPEQWRSQLTNDSIANLRSWKLEPSESEDHVRVTYDYISDTSLPKNYKLDVKFALPDQITVAGNPAMPPRDR